MNCKTWMALAMAVGTTAATAEPYTVTVGKGEDRSLSSTEVTAVLASTELVKAGVGKLTVGSELATFTGKITVQAGVYEVTNGGAFGTGAGKTYVEKGAALVLKGASTDAVKNETEEIHLAGTGTDDYPGALVNAGKSVQYACKKLYLDSDATFAVTETGSTAGICWGQLYFEGHTLTVNAPDVYRRFSINRTEVKTAGHIDVVKGALILVGNYSHTWAGSAANTVTIRKGAQLYLSQSKAIVPWTLNLENGSTFVPDGATGFQDLAYNRWDGPVCCQPGTDAVYGNWSAGMSLVLGPLTGTGTYCWGGGWVYLDGEGASGTGRLQFSGSAAGGLGINKTTAVSSKTREIEMRSGDVTLTAVGDYDLPPLKVSGEAGKEYAVSGGRGILASFTKTGASTELLDARLCVTGLTEIAGGTVKLPRCNAYGKPGLSVGWCSPSSPGTEWWTRNTYTNRTALSIEHAYANYNDPANDFNGYTFATYTGTIWNREETNVTWTVASWMETGAFLYKTTSGYSAVLQQTGGDLPKKAQLTLEPGANYFEVRLYRADNINPRYKRSTASSWPENFGFVVDRQGRDTLDPSYFEKFEDPGDGSLFTCGSRSEVVSSDFRASMTDVKLSGGTLDLNDREIAFPVSRLEGVGTVSNGKCVVTNALRVISSAALAGGIVFSDADLVLAEGATLVVDKTLKKGFPDAGAVIATLTGNGTLSLPEEKLCSVDGDWYVRADSDGNLRLFRDKRGIVLIVR